MRPQEFIVAELLLPGTAIDQSHPHALTIFLTISALESALNEAALALTFYEPAEVEANVLPSMSESREYYAFWSKRKSQIIEESRPGDLNGIPYFPSFNDPLELDAERTVRREQLRQGRIPAGYRNLMLLMYKKSFLYAMDTISKHISALAKDSGLTETERTAIATIKQDFDTAFPHLSGVRNTDAHSEDRIRLKDQRGRTINLQPGTNPLTDSPHMEILSINTSHGNNIGSTLADGSYGQVEVSRTSLFTARDCIQRVIDSFTWIGFARFTPGI